LAEIPVARGEDKKLRKKGGRRAAQSELDRFFDIEPLKRYPFQISSPLTAWNGGSRISTYLAYGIISDREVFQAVDRAVTKAHSQLSEDQFERFESNARFYLDRLRWRRNYLQTFEDKPEIEYQYLMPEFEGVRESEFNPAHFKAWTEGRTGIPYVDAGIRSLNQTGWLNMRLRSTILSFATHNLWIPTFKVAEYLAREFLDYEPGIHFPIHQLSSGTTPSREIMVYDPIKQGLDHDTEGKFIQRWVPELSDLPAPAIHSLYPAAGHLSAAAEKYGYAPYPKPIVDYKSTTKLAKDRIQSIKNGGLVKGKVVSAEGPVQQSLF